MKNLIALALYLVAQLLIFRLICVEYAQYKVQQYKLSTLKPVDSAPIHPPSCQNENAALQDRF